MSIYTVSSNLQATVATMDMHKKGCSRVVMPFSPHVNAQCLTNSCPAKKNQHTAMPPIDCERFYSPL